MKIAIRHVRGSSSIDICARTEYNETVCNFSKTYEEVIKSGEERGVLP